MLQLAGVFAEAAFEEPILNGVRIGTAADFQDVGRTYFDRMRFARAGELDVEDGAREMDVIGDRAGVPRIERSAAEDVFRLARNGFALVVVEENLEFAKCNGGDAIETTGIERALALGAQRLECVGRAMGEVIEAATEVEAELLNVKLALALSTGVDADFIKRRRVNDDIIALRTIVEDFCSLLPNFWRTNEDVAMANEKPVFAAKWIDFDASSFGTAMVGGEPGIEREG